MDGNMYKTNTKSVPFTQFCEFSYSLISSPHFVPVLESFRGMTHSSAACDDWLGMLWFSRAGWRWSGGCGGDVGGCAVFDVVSVSPG